MKQVARDIQIVVIAVMTLLVTITSVSAQPDAEAKSQQVDTRIWSQSYWLKMAKLGLVEVAPEVPVKDAVYTTSKITVRGVTQDSPDVPVTNDANTTQSENSIFVHPLDINAVLNSNNSTTWPSVSVLGADALFSDDGGQTWGGSIQGAGGPNSGDPATAIGLNGWYYVGYIADDGGQGVAHSTDDGATWTHVQAASPGGALLDKNHLWIDNSPSSPYEGNLYSAWTNFYGVNNDEIELVRSTDNGLSWSAPINISSAVNAGNHNQGVNIQTGPRGNVYVVWSIYDTWPSDETAIGFAMSIDGGATFTPATRIIENTRGIRTTTTSKSMRCNSFPVMAVDISGGLNNGNIYIVWANIGEPGINNGPDIDVYMIMSIGGVSNWSTPVKVNQDASGLGKEHYFPWITCDPVMGALSVIFYDDRNVSSTDCEVFVSASADAGVSWIDFKVSDISFTPSPIPGLAGGYFGDYLGISARSGKVYPCWTDNRQGSGRAMTYVSPFALEPDTVPPAAVSDLAVIDSGSTWITLTWTASGDDGDSGRASSYDIRYSTSPIDENNFDSATAVLNPPTPQEPDSTEVFKVTGLDFNTTYYFAVKVRDEWTNHSGISNSASGTTLGIPDIQVSPDSFYVSLGVGQIITRTLTISNVGQDPSTLDFLLPQYEGAASLRVTSAVGDRLRIQIVPVIPEERSYPRKSGKDHQLIQGQGSSYHLYDRFMSNLSADVIVFFSDMEGGPGGWNAELYGGTTDDLWHLTNTSYNSPVTSWWCGIEGQGNYDNGNIINTAIISPSIDLTIVTAPITLQFFESYDTESGWDYCMVDVTTNGGVSWTPLRGDYGSSPSGSSGGWVMSVLDLSAFEGEVIQLRFYFDTGDDIANDYPGWFFDDVLVTAAGFVFLSVAPSQGTVQANNSVELTVTFDATLLTGGDFEAEIEITSNDPDEPQVLVPTLLHVTGEPDIAVSDDTLDLGDAYLGFSKIDTLFVFNAGADSLTISSITSDNPDYTVDTTNFVLYASQSQRVLVTFTPTSSGPSNGTLTITSDDPDEPTIPVAMLGNGAVAPVISAVPDTIRDTLFEGDSTTHLLTISNVGIGGADLIWSISILPAHDSAKNVASNNSGLSDLTGVNIMYDRSHWQASSNHKGTLKADLLTRGATFTDNSQAITTQLLEDYHVLWFSALPEALSGSEMAAIKSWVTGGGALLIESKEPGSIPNFNSLLSTLNAGIVHSPVTSRTEGVSTNIFPHGMTQDVDSIFMNLGATLASVELPANVLIADTSGVANTAYSVAGNGRIVVTADRLFHNTHIMSGNNRLFGNQVFSWLAEQFWLTATPSTDTIPAGSSMDVTLTFDAAGQACSNYVAEVLISSNDPVDPLVTSRAYLTVHYCGDVNYNCQGPNIADLVFLVDYLFRNGNPPPLTATADLDGLSGVNIADLTYLVEYFFHNGPAPVCSL